MSATSGIPRAPQIDIPDAVLSAVRRAVVSAVLRIDVVTQPWQGATQTRVVSFEDVDPLVVQWSPDRAGIRRRAAATRHIRTHAPAIPVPEIVVDGSGASIAFIATRSIAGVSAARSLEDEAGAAELAETLGLMARGLSRVPLAGPPLSRTWADPSSLERAARRWISGAVRDLGERAAIQAGTLLRELPPLFAGAAPVFAHGDFVPVNVLVRDGAVVGLLDLERARIAHPLFDAAWFRATVRHHHPAWWGIGGRSFLVAAGVPDAPGTMARLDLLAALQTLEALDVGAGSASAGRADRIARCRAAIDEAAVAQAR